MDIKQIMLRGGKYVVCLDGRGVADWYLVEWAQSRRTVRQTLENTIKQQAQQGE